MVLCFVQGSSLSRRGKLAYVFSQVNQHGTCWELELCMFPLWLPHGPGVFCLPSHQAAQLGHEEDTERSFPEPRNRNHTAFSKIHYFLLMVCLALESISHIGNPASLSFQLIALPKVITKAQEYLYKFWMSHQTFSRKVLWRKHI